jgi:hypothetical protein
MKKLCLRLSFIWENNIEMALKEKENEDVI